MGSLGNAFIWTSHDTVCEFNCCVDFIKMTKNLIYLKCDLMLSSLSPLTSPSFLSSRPFSFSPLISSFSSVVHRKRRRRRQITIYYKYCSHGVFYVLLLLIYSYFLIQSPAIVLADTALSQIKSSGSNELIKSSNEMDHAVSAIKLDKHFEDESFDEHDDGTDDGGDYDSEYKDLLSNKSGNQTHIGFFSFVSFFHLFWSRFVHKTIQSFQPKGCTLVHRAMDGVT